MTKNFKEVLLMYDISETSRRNKIVKEGEDFGLIPFQKSIMWGKLLEPEIRSLRSSVNKLADGKTDKVAVIPTSVQDNIKGSLGYETFYFPEPGDDIII